MRTSRPRPAALPRTATGTPAAAPVFVAPDYAVTGAKLGWAVLAYVGCVVLVITLQPFAFAVPTAVRVLYWAPDGPWHGWFDVLANVALFLPLGFLAALARSALTPATSDRSLGWALLGGAIASAAVELAQCFEPGRYPSPTDVAANALGAWLGAWLRRRAAGYLGVGSPLVGRLALELPVVGLVYVTLPLVTLAGLTVAGAPGVEAPRALGLVALGAFGGVLLGTVQRRHFAPAGAAGAGATAGAAAIWFATGALPAAVTAPPWYFAGVAVTAAATWLVGRRAVAGVHGIERRFESEALGRAAPWLAAYLTFVPLDNPASAVWGRLTILRDLEEAAGFTVLGYLLAEWWGRREWRYRHSAWRVALAGAVAAAGALAVESAAGVPLGAWTAMSGLAVRAAAAAYGGWIYHLQRAHVRALVAARRAPNTRAAAGRNPAAALAA